MEVAQLLPLELIVEILLWLPVKSLLRFRCLSKCFCALIDSSAFINTHLSRSSQTFNLRKLIFLDALEIKLRVFDWNVDLVEEIHPLERPVSSTWREVFGYCNGLLLLKRPDSQFALWNPSTRQYRAVPYCPFKLPAATQFYSKSGSSLGYDESTDEYKSFHLVYVGRTGGKGEFEYEVQVWFYGVKTNSWVRTQSQKFKFVLDPDSPKIGHFVDGSVHWLCKPLSNRYHYEIVAFDVSKETLSMVPLPASSTNSMKGVSAGLHLLEGSLCISFFSLYMPRQADLYVRKKDGVGGFTWTQLYSVKEPLFFDIFRFRDMNLLGYSKTGDKIMLNLGMGYMVSYDLKEKSFVEFELDGHSNWNYPILCVQSLVSVGGGA